MFRRFENPAAVETITMDMCKAYREAAEDVLHGARIIVDRFHLVKSLNDKVAETSKALYASTKRQLETALGIKPSAIELDPALDDDSFDNARILRDLKDTLDIPLELADWGKGRIISKDLPNELYLTQKLDVLKSCYCYRWFTMNPESLSDMSALRFYTLLVNFPEFKNLYDIKEKLRYDFFMSMDASAARAVAAEASAMIPKGANYKPLKTYLKTLNSAEWSRHIYAYFDDPIDDPTKPLPEGAVPKKRYTNAKLEGFNKIVKEINAAARGLKWEELKAKILYGNLSAKHRPRRFKQTKPRPKRPSKEHAGIALAAVTAFLSFYDTSCVSSPALYDWDTVFAIPAVQEKMIVWGLGTMSTRERVSKLHENNNLRGSLLSVLQDDVALLADFPDDETHEVIRYLRFSDWEANKDQYLAMIASDAAFLNRLDNTP